MIQADLSKNTVEGPARTGYSVTPHDTNEIGDYLPKAIYVGTGGTIVCKLIDSQATSLTFTNVPDGALLPIRPIVILATGTTASGIVALY